jgi:uncharacterized protein (TIGR00255 family)
MLQSMTGYGKADISLPEKKITIEIKTLNSKTTDVNLKLPQTLRDREMEIRQLLASELERGKIDCILSSESNEGNNLSVINREAFLSYSTQIQELMQEQGMKISADTLLQAILRMPDTVRIEKAELAEAEWNEIQSGILHAIAEVKKFRKQDGTTIASGFRAGIGIIIDLLSQVERFEKQRIEKISDKILKGIEELRLGEEVDKNRFEQEMIYYIEKLDISEEKARLGHHCRFFLDTMDKEDAAGKKLSFILQEIGREINTLGSKANDHDIQQRVVNMKDELEKIKEQTANVL